MDTTAKVDIRKLQLLNDRIAQTIEALNQVRLSVHGLGGLSHTSGGPFGNMGGYGVPGVQGLQGLQGLGGIQGLQGINPFQQGNPYGYGQNLGGIGGNGGFGMPGIQHTSPFGYPQQQLGGFNPQQQLVGWPQQQLGGYPQQQLGGFGVPGIQHTSPFGYPQQQLGGWPQQGLPFQQQPWGQGIPQQLGQIGQFGQGIPQQQLGGFGGISHTSPELDLVNRLGLDPFTAARIAQSFPFAMF
jgi:hypothetical protein